MNKASKGALAAAAGGALLLGGAGSLAYWSGSASVAGGTLNSGKLTIADSTVGTCAAAPWMIDNSQAPGAGVFDPVAETLVPGDTVTKTCTFTIGADGTHLRADLTAAGGGTSGALAPALTVNGTFDVDGAPVTFVTEADDTKTLTATISVTFNPASGNTTQLQAADLSDYTVTLSQVHG